MHLEGNQQPNININTDDTSIDFNMPNQGDIKTSVDEISINFSVASATTLDLQGQGGTSGGSGTKDHSQLNNRELADQHPISAITGLEEALNSTATSEDIEQINQNIQYLNDNKQDNLTQSQLNAVNSGLTAEMVQIVSEHIGDRNNPHKVTKSQVGLSNVDNTSDLNKPISIATQQALEGKQEQLNQQQLIAVNSGISADLISIMANHLSNFNNPHEVNKNDVGLNNVDNTSDLNKPISTATQNALNNKADKSEIPKISADNNIYVDNEYLKAYTEAGNKAVTTEFARLLDLPISIVSSNWQSLITDTGWVILYIQNAMIRTKDGYSFDLVYFPTNINSMDKAYQNNTIYASTNSNRYLISTDDGLTWQTVTDSNLKNKAWHKVVCKNSGSKATGYRSYVLFTNEQAVSSDNYQVAYYNVASNYWEFNTQGNNQIQFVDYGDNYFWMANTTGQVFKTTGTSVYSYYPDTKAGLNCISYCNDNVYCGFTDGTIAELISYSEGWNYYTVGGTNEAITDIQYHDGKYYVVTNQANYYTSTDLATWEKTKIDGITYYGGTINFTDFGILIANKKAVLIPSRQRIENALLELYNKTNHNLICGKGVTSVNGQLQVNIQQNSENPLAFMGGFLTLRNIPSSYFDNTTQIALSNAQFTIDYCDAENYDGWLWGDGSSETGYWDSSTFAGKTVLFIMTSDGTIYDPVGYTNYVDVIKYDIIRMMYDFYGLEATLEKIGSFAPLVDLIKGA